MFGRRVFGSSAIPRALYANLHISSQAQASRMLPSLVPLSSVVSAGSQSMVPLVRHTSVSASVVETAEVDPVLLTDFLESLSQTRVGFLRLLELWGIGRMAMSDALFWQRRSPQSSSLLV